MPPPVNPQAFSGSTLQIVKGRLPRINGAGVQLLLDPEKLVVLGNPVGALFGGLVLGVLEGIIPAFLESSWVPVIEFGLFVIILLVRPSGLFGAKQ